MSPVPCCVWGRPVQQAPLGPCAVARCPVGAAGGLSGWAWGPGRGGRPAVDTRGSSPLGSVREWLALLPHQQRPEDADRLHQERGSVCHGKVSIAKAPVGEAGWAPRGSRVGSSGEAAPSAGGLGSSGKPGGLLQKALLSAQEPSARPPLGDQCLPLGPSLAAGWGGGEGSCASSLEVQALPRLPHCALHSAPSVTCASKAPNPGPPRGTRSSGWWTSPTSRRWAPAPIHGFPWEPLHPHRSVPWGLSAREQAVSTLPGSQAQQWAAPSAEQGPSPPLAVVGHLASL